MGCLYFSSFYCVLNMSSHQSNKDKPRASKCHHFCHPFDSHNYCPTCREAGKGDDPCVTLLSPCEICASFTEEQQPKIIHRKRYIKKDKKSDKNDGDADLLGDTSVDSFEGSQAELEVAAERLFTSPPPPSPSTSCLRGIIFKDSSSYCPAYSRYGLTTKTGE